METGRKGTGDKRKWGEQKQKQKKRDQQSDQDISRTKVYSEGHGAKKEHHNISISVPRYFYYEVYQR